MFEPVSLSTARLRIRALRHDDAPALFTIWSDAEAMRYFSFAPMRHVDEAHARIASTLKPSSAGKDLVCTVEARDSGEVLGTCDLFHLHAQCRRAEIGFSLQRQHWGKGLMSEAAAAVVDHAFDTVKLNRIEADIDPRNVASARVLERLGFQREGLLRERWIVGEEVTDSALYGLLRSDRRVRG
ncbi:GNAT family N-acetyltransferase [Burkholderia sp. Ax-1719]|jgi:[ribosomal protein S5]-alanine N-acetyltransferase|uniref:GNAT family N-acetyltransferase n=1 Tax=Burkholderia sp. Ax-1719 TaxID=2608334 RepID=UPI00141DE1FF|nr:GNAT family N-acetyltransferase [Burkholderia sp. Ax-1719]NIE62498.1 GNAT family N-acetyltransferase [Burkholderia sp. Ax-1719]